MTSTQVSDTLTINVKRGYGLFDNYGPRPTLAAERLSRQQRLAAALRIFAQRGFDSGGPGHITVRDPEWEDHFWVNPIGVRFEDMRVSDLLLVNGEGAVVHGERPLNRAAFAIHSALHKARPDVIGAAHAHTLYGKTWSTLGRLLDPITQDAAAFYGNHALFDDYTGGVFDISEGERIGAALGDKKAVILRNHGLLTVGPTLDAAIWWFIAMEDAAHVQLLAEAAGTPLPMRAEVAAEIGRNTELDKFAWLAFQSLYEKIVREQPDLLA